MRHLRENIGAKIKSFVKYGDANYSDKHKDDVIDALLDMSLKNPNVHVTDYGLIVSHEGSEYKLMKKSNAIAMPYGSEIFLSKREFVNLYNGILKNSFIEE